MTTPFDQELARRHLGDFGSLLVTAPRPYEHPPHVEMLCQHLERVESGEITRLLVTAPPRHSKSLHVARLLPAWWLGRHPAHHVILASHGADLSEEHSREARRLMRHDLYPFPARVSDESHAVGRWHTDASGSMRAVGVKGAITGHGAHLLILDDLLSGIEAASSQAVRDSTWAWLVNDALSRLMPGGAVVAIGTRWHEDDPMGRLLDMEGGDEWTVLRFPALAEEDDALGRAPGEALWPTWYDASYHHARRAELGLRWWSATHQGAPTPDDGVVFKRPWLTGTYETLPEELHVVTGCDASFGKGVGSDYSALVTLATDGTRYYVLDTERGRWEFNELVERIKRVEREYHPSVVLVEDAAAGQSAIQELHRLTDLPVVAVKPEGSKLARAESVSPLVEAGRLLFPHASPPWKDELIEELASFPSGRHDDMVDALVYALRRLKAKSSSGAGVSGAVMHTRRGTLVKRPGKPDRIASGVSERQRRRRRREHVHPREADD
jgi:predicted phage terminase large subunit-like protein